MPFPLPRSLPVAGWQLSTPGLFLILAALAAYLLILATAQRAPRESGARWASEHFPELLPAGWAGARLAAQLAGFDLSWSPLSWFRFHEEALNLEGGIIAALLYAYLRSGRSWSLTLSAGDALAPALAAGASIAWLGFGYVGAAGPAWAWMSEPLPGLHLHPVQLYAYLLFAGLALLLAWQGQRPDYPGQNLWSFLLFAAVIRFGLAGLTPVPGTTWLGLSGTQWGAAVGACLGWAGMAWSQRRALHPRKEVEENAMKRPVGSVFAALLVGVISLFLLGTNASGDGSLPLAGYRAPHFELRTLDGEFRLQELQEKRRPALINFWASWCPPCREEMPHLQRLHEEYGDRLRIVGVDLREAPSTVASFVQEHGYTWTFALDRDGQVSETYRVRSIPTSFFVDGRGVIRRVYLGPMTYPQMQRYAADLLAGAR